MNATAPYIAIDLFCVIIGWAIGSSKGHPGLGVFLGLFGPLGLLFIMIQTPTPAIQAARLEAVESERARLREADAPAPRRSDAGEHGTMLAEQYADGGGCGPGCSCVS